MLVCFVNVCLLLNNRNVRPETVLVLCLYVMILTVLFIQYIYDSGFCKFLNELFGRLHHIFCL